MPPRSLTTRLGEHAETLAILLRSGACAEKTDSAWLVAPTQDGYGLAVGQLRDLVTTLRETIAKLNLPQVADAPPKFPIVQRERDDAPPSTSRGAASCKIG